MENALEEIKTIQKTVKEQVNESLQTIAAAAEKIAADVLGELDTFHNQLHNSFSALGKDFKGVFEDLTKQIAQQRDESDQLRQQLQTATKAIAEQNVETTHRMQEAMEEERKQAAEEREDLLQMAILVNSQAGKQEARLLDRTAQLQNRLTGSNDSLQDYVAQHGDRIDAWNQKQNALLDQLAKSRDTMKMKLEDNWNAANGRCTSIKATAESVNAETMRVAKEQAKDLDMEMEAFDGFVALARSEQASHHERHTDSVRSLSAIVERSFDTISSCSKMTFQRVEGLGSEIEARSTEAQQRLEPLGKELREPLGNLREEVMATSIKEYEPTGATPIKVQYRFPTNLPRTQTHARLLANLDNLPASSSKSEVPTPAVLPDTLGEPSGMCDAAGHEPTTGGTSNASSLAMVPEKQACTAPKPPGISLREVNPNLMTGLLTTTDALPFSPMADGSSTDTLDMTVEKKPEALFKRASSRLRSKGDRRKTQTGMLPIVPLEGRENFPLSSTAFSQSLGPPRKSRRRS